MPDVRYLFLCRAWRTFFGFSASSRVPIDPYAQIILFPFKIITVFYERAYATPVTNQPSSCFKHKVILFSSTGDEFICIYPVIIIASRGKIQVIRFDGEYLIMQCSSCIQFMVPVESREIRYFRNGRKPVTDGNFYP